MVDEVEIEDHKGAMKYRTETRTQENLGRSVPHLYSKYMH